MSGRAAQKVKHVSDANVLLKIFRQHNLDNGKSENALENNSTSSEI